MALVPESEARIQNALLVHFSLYSIGQLCYVPMLRAPVMTVDEGADFAGLSIC
jgi:hypothetical protein